MDTVFSYIEKYKFAIIGTILFHVIVFLATNFTTIQRPFHYVEPAGQTDIPFEEIELDPEMMKLLEVEPKEKDNGAPEEILNAASDENDSRNESDENFSTSQIDAEVMNDAKSLEQQYFSEWASTHNDQGNKTADIEIDEQKNDEKKNNSGPDNTIDKGGDHKAAGDVLVSYNLKNRKAHSLPKPGYTCNRSGTVKLDIKVSQDGEIKSVSFNSSESSNADECMVQQAIRFAKRSRFDFSSSAPSSQSGTITYKFVGQ